MPERKKLKPAVLRKWRFVPAKKGPGGAARYWWSDGTKTEEKLPSYMEAVSRLKGIQDGGGVKG